VDDFAEAHAQHIEILQLIRKGDLAELLAKIEDHLDYTAQTVSQAL
jgi:DNA-binding GntR family transcriptional regulator